MPFDSIAAKMAAVMFLLNFSLVNVNATPSAIVASPLQDLSRHWTERVLLTGPGCNAPADVGSKHRRQHEG
jgi:hypothetical protein